MANPYLDTVGEEPESAPAQSNPYMDSIDAEEEPAAPEVRAVLLKNLDANPEQAARARSLGTRMGLPADLVERNLPELEKKVRFEEQTALVTKSPKLARALQADPSLGRIGGDELPTLAQIEVLGAKLPKPRPLTQAFPFRPASEDMRRQRDRFDAALSRTIGSATRLTAPAPSVSSIASGVATTVGNEFENSRAGLRLQMADLLGNDELIADEINARRDRDFETEVATPGIESATGRGLYGALVSIGVTAPTIAAAFTPLGAGVGLGLMGLQTQSSAYGKYRERGGEAGESFLAATGEGAVEVATEKLALGFMVDKLGKVGFGKFVTGLLAREIPGEQVATFVQDAIDTAVANPDKSWDDYWAERAGRQYETLVATIGQAALMGGAGRVMSIFATRDAQANQAEETQNTLKSMIDLVQASQTATRSPETLAQFIDTASEGGEVKDIFVDARTFEQAAGASLPELLAASPTLAAQYDEAVQTGGDIVIPVGEFATTIGATEAVSRLLPHLRTAAGDMSAEEAKVYLQEREARMEEAAEQVLAENANDVAFLASAATVEQNLNEQLTQANRFTSAVNQRYAKLMSAFYTTLADRTGVTPEEMFQRYPIRVQAEGATGGREFDQITPQQAMETNVELSMPQDPAFSEAVGNTEGAQITPDGLLIDLVRFQKPEQEGAQAIRTGVFYLPSRSKNARYYRTSPSSNNAETTYGGTEKMSGTTLIRRPLFVKGATGGKAPEAAYAALKGKDALKVLDKAVTGVVSSRGFMSRIDADSFLMAVKQFLDDFGGDRGMASEIIRNSKKGNTLRYALQEHVIAHTVRAAGYDAVVGYSKGKAGASLSEVFDVREQTFPARGMESEVHSAFLQTDTGLSGREFDQPDVAARFQETFDADPQAMADEYIARFGNLVDPDLAKRMSPEYEADNSLAYAVHETSSSLAKQVYATLLSKAAGGNVLFTAGGGGSGKTEAMPVAQAAIGITDADFIYDSTLSSFDSAVSRIDQALAAGVAVDIVYTNRPVEDAFRFALTRPRVVPAQQIAKAHVGASNVIRQLTQHYAADARVSIVVVNNTGSIDDMTIGDVADVPEYEYDQVERRLYEIANETLVGQPEKLAAVLAGAPESARGEGLAEVQGGQQGAQDGRPVQTGLSGRRTSLDNFRPGNVSSILARDDWTILTAHNPMGVQLSPEENVARNELLVEELQKRGLEFDDSIGKYVNDKDNDPPEDGFIVYGVTPEIAHEIGNMFEQDSVLINRGLLYFDNTLNPVENGLVEHETPPDNYFTRVPSTGALFTMNIDFGTRVPFVREFAQTEDRGRVDDVAVVHYSKEPRVSLSSSFYGRGMKGAEYERVMSSPDLRLRERVHFYVSSGTQVVPESNVGNVAHVARVSNLYDADLDHLKLRKGRDANGFESAVLDSGYSGYISRAVFGKQGAVVMLGKQDVNVKQTADPMAELAVPPAPRFTDAEHAAREIAADKRLPAGAQTPSSWREYIGRVAPDWAVRIGPQGWATLGQMFGDTAIYRADLGRAFDTYAEADAERTAMREKAAGGLSLFSQGGDTRGQIAFGADITQQPSVITLFEKANLSTFLHESGHFMLEVMADVASRPGAPAGITDDMGKLLSWFGVPDLATWRAMTPDQQRPHHERFARGFESYLFEGKAPSQELNGIFATFRAWLLAVYKQITALNVNVSDEVRGVMDRMLATDEQIKAAVDARGFAPLFKTAEEMGATQAEWEAYQAENADALRDATDQQQARSLRDMQWLSRARGRVLRELQRQAAETRKAVEAEATATTRAEPVYAAMRWLKHGEMVGADGELIKAATGFKLDIDMVRALFPDDVSARPDLTRLGFGKYGMVMKEGLDPQIVAEMFGFRNGIDLVVELTQASPEAEAIEGLTDQLMLERYGDLNSQEAMERAADEALHNDARGRFVATELKALAKALGKTEKSPRGGSVNSLARAAKDLATQLVARVKVKDIRPAKYSTAEARAGRAAQKALTAGDLKTAVTEKRNQMVNLYAAKQAYLAREEVEKGLRAMKRALESDGIDQGYKDQIAQILDRYQLRPLTQKEQQRAKSLVDWVESQKAAGYEPVIDPLVLNDARRMPIRELTLEEFRGVVDAIENIAHLGRLKKKLLTAKDARDFAARVAEAEATIRDNAKRSIPEELEATRWARFKSGVKEFFVMHIKFANQIREMDGWTDGGPLWELFVRPLNEAGDMEATMREQATVRLSALFDTISKGSTKKVYIPEIRASLSLEGRLMVALNTGNAGNLQRLMDGDRWTAAQVQAVVDTLTKEQMDFVQAVWDMLDEYRPLIGAQQKRLTGVEPNWVEATPVQTKHGTYRGGYMPAKYDTKRSTRSLSDEAAGNVLDQWRAARNAPKARSGFVEARAEAVKDRPLRKDFGVITQHITEVTHRLAFQDWLIDATRLLRAGPIDGAIREHYGPEVLQSMRDAVADIAAGEVGAQNAFESSVNWLRTGATITGLGWRVTTALLQPLGLTQSMVRIGPKWVAKGLAQWIGSAAKMENAVAQVYGKSEFMRLRGKTMQREISEIRNKVSGRDSRIEASYFYMIQKLQIVADMPTWLGQYTKAIEGGESEARAVALADQAVIDAQSGGQVKDLSAIQRGGPLLKLFTNFYSFFNTTYNLTRESVGRTNFKSPASIGLLAVDMLLLYTIPAVLGEMMKAALDVDEPDEEELVAKLVTGQINYLLGTMVGLREIGGAVSAAAGLPSGYGGPAGVRFFGELQRLSKQVEQGEADEAFFKALNSSAGILFHYPAGQINNTLSGLAAMIEGRTENPAALITGGPSP